MPSDFEMTGLSAIAWREGTSSRLFVDTAHALDRFLKLYRIAESSRMARPSIAGVSRNRPKGHAKDRMRRQRYRDVPSVAPGVSRRRAGSARHPGALSLGLLWICACPSANFCGRAPRVQMCSRQIRLWARKDKLAESDHSAGSGMGRTTFARRATSREGRCRFGQPTAGPKGKPHGRGFKSHSPAG